MTSPDPPALGGSWVFDPQTGVRTRVAWTRPADSGLPVSDHPASAANPEPDGEDDQ